MGKGDKKTKKGKIRSRSYGKSRRKKEEDQNIPHAKLRKWSIEWLFFNIGRFDFTVTIQFKKSTDSFRKFSSDITGTLYYTDKERKVLNSKINSGIRTEVNGKVKFQASGINDLNQELVKELLKEGFENTDILTLFFLPYKENQSYFSNKNKNLSPPIRIGFTPTLSTEESIRGIYRIYKERISEGDFLAIHEKLDMSAIQVALKINETDESYKHQEIVNNQKVDFAFRLEKYLFLLQQKNSISNKVFRDKYDEIDEIVKVEFEKAGINLRDKSEFRKYSGIYLGILKIGIEYKDKILLYASTPKVVLDFKGFIHVAFRHCPTFNIGKANEYKSRVPYKLSDLETLIEHCLKSVEKDIKDHFMRHPGKRFSRFKDELIRFNGNYFEVHINKDGIIETFYNH